MAFAIAGPVFGKVVSQQRNQLQIADDAVPATHAPTNTVDGTARRLNDPCVWFFWEVYQKTFTLGTATIQQLYRPEVATDDFVAGIRQLGLIGVDLTANAAGFGIGKSPDGNGKRFARVVSIANGTGTGTVDLLGYAV